MFLKLESSMSVSGALYRGKKKLLARNVESDRSFPINSFRLKFCANYVSLYIHFDICIYHYMQLYVYYN